MIGLTSVAFALSVATFSLAVIDDLPILNEQKCANCSRVYVPVCGSDNNTYVNACKLKCWNDEVKKRSDKVSIQFYGTCVENVVDNT